jgi:hypothetical protein
MSGLTVEHTVGQAVSVIDGDVLLLRYVYRPDTKTQESPKPFFHPICTRAGNPVTLFRPHDHTWHTGLAWAIPNVGDQNFMGGPTYIRGVGYAQLPNNGSQQHSSILDIISETSSATFAHEVNWITEAEDPIIAERRELRASLLNDDAWMLEFSTTLTNVSAAPISIGSPTTEGRENAGYGGLFWRLPRSFTGGSIVTATGVGGDELRGTRQEWMGFSGFQDGSGAPCTVVIVDHPNNPRHPPQWHARSEDFACLNPAPFFSEKLDLDPGATISFSYGAGISDSGVDNASGLAELVRFRSHRLEPITP